MEELKKWLKEGKITQAEYDALINEINANIKAVNKEETTVKQNENESKLAEILATLTDKEPKHNIMLMNEAVKMLDKKYEIKQAELTKQLDAVVAQLEIATSMLGEQKLKNEAAEKAMNEKLENERKSKVIAAIEDAKKTGKIPPENKEQEEKWIEILNGNYETGIAILNAVPSKINENNSSKIIGGVNNIPTPTPFGSGLNSKIYESLAKQPDYSPIV